MASKRFTGRARVLLSLMLNNTVPENRSHLSNHLSKMQFGHYKIVIWEYQIGKNYILWVEMNLAQA